jgi:hypothetical protein
MSFVGVGFEVPELDNSFLGGRDEEEIVRAWGLGILGTKTTPPFRCISERTVPSAISILALLFDRTNEWPSDIAPCVLYKRRVARGAYKAFLTQ